MSQGTSHVTLGGAMHALAPMTIGRLEDLFKASEAEHPSPIARAVAILNTVVAAPISAATPGTLSELNDAVRAAYKHAGFKESAPGEGEAPAASGAV